MSYTPLAVRAAPILRPLLALRVFAAAFGQLLHILVHAASKAAATEPSAAHTSREH